MLEYLKQFLNIMPPTNISQWNQHINELKIRREEIKRRFLNFYGDDSRGLRVLKHVAGSIDTDYLKFKKNDFEAYSDYFSEFASVADYIFNPTKFGKAYRKMFYRKVLFSTTEYLVPNNDIDHIKILPFGEPWDKWKDLKPVTLWWHNSTEHTYNLYTDQVVFKYNQPTYAVTYIDSTMLGMMWWKYSQLPIQEDEKTLHVFLHRYVFSKLFEDLEDIWLMNRLIMLVSEQTEDDYSKVDTLFGYTGGRVKEANTRFRQRLMDVKNGNVRPNTLLSTPLLLSGSILEKIHYALEYLDTEHLSQYEYTRILRDLPYLEFILKLYSYKKDNSLYHNFTQQLRIILKRYMNTKPWNTIVDGGLKVTIEEKIKDLYDRVKDDN